jgi:hypothetical protein
VTDVLVPPTDLGADPPVDLAVDFNVEVDVDFEVDFVEELPSVRERVVISLVAGRFQPAPGLQAGCRVNSGWVIGHVFGHGTQSEVHSLFEGTLMALMAHPDERVRVGQPVAWLRADAAS